MTAKIIGEGSFDNRLWIFMGAAVATACPDFFGVRLKPTFMATVGEMGGEKAIAIVADKGPFIKHP